MEGIIVDKVEYKLTVTNALGALAGGLSVEDENGCRYYVKQDFNIYKDGKVCTGLNQHLFYRILEKDDGDIK